MNKRYTITAAERLTLRSIEFKDLELLRTWKNEHKEAFFHQEEINKQQQADWFREYKARNADHMLMVEVDKVSIGCMGFRMLTPYWDVYNVICGDPKYQGLGWMSRALVGMHHYMLSRANVVVKARVLKDNIKALGWYGRQGYYVWVEHADHFELNLNTLNCKTPELFKIEFGGDYD